MLNRLGYITIFIFISFIRILSCHPAYEALHPYLDLKNNWKDIIGNELPIYNCNGEDIVTTFSEDNSYTKTGNSYSKTFVLP